MPSSRGALPTSPVRADELQESRRRLVDTHDAERRRLERDIHDGAQQHLVALVVNLRLAQTLVGEVTGSRPGPCSASRWPRSTPRSPRSSTSLVGSTREPSSSTVSARPCASVRSGRRSRSPTRTSAASPATSRPLSTSSPSRRSRTRPSTPAPRRSPSTCPSDGGRVSLAGPRRRPVASSPRTGSTGHGLGNMRDRIDAIAGHPRVGVRPRPRSHGPRDGAHGGPGDDRRGWRHDAHLRPESPGRWRWPAWCSSWSTPLSSPARSVSSRPGRSASTAGRSSTSPPVGCAVLGAVIVGADRRQPIGWLLNVIGMTTAVSMVERVVQPLGPLRGWSRAERTAELAGSLAALCRRVPRPGRARGDLPARPGRSPPGQRLALGRS